MQVNRAKVALALFAAAQAKHLKHIGGRLTRRHAFRLLQVEEQDSDAAEVAATWKWRAPVAS